MTIGRLRILAPENLTPFSTAGHASTHELPLSDSHRTPQPPTMPETPNMTPLFVLRFLKTSLAVPGRKSVRRRIRSGLKIEGLEARIALAITQAIPMRSPTSVTSAPTVRVPPTLTSPTEQTRSLDWL